MMLSALSVLVFALSAAGDAPRAAGDIYLQTDSFALILSADARVTGVMDLRAGEDYGDPDTGVPFAAVRRGGETFPATAASYENEQLTLEFAGVKGRAVLCVTSEPRRIEFEVSSLTCERAAELVFAQIPTTLRGAPDESFAISPLALNLETNCAQIPGLCPGLTGFTAPDRFGFRGAKGAVVAAPMAGLRDALKEALQSAEGLEHSPLGGPWAQEAKINRGSYLIATEDVTEANVAYWIQAAHSVGATQLDLHGGHAFRWGDYEVNRDVYPRGRDSLKAVVDTIHAAGMAAGLHTYAFFVSKETPWVTPVPDDRLDTDAVFTLADGVDADATEVAVNEDTAAMSAVTGFQVRNSATLRVGGELITYTGVSKEEPYAFTGCTRGALGTKAARHARGAKALHLKECFGLFVPRGDSTLFTEVARRTADLFNECGFDMLYLDALDGADILAGGPHAWHYAAKFTHELARRLDRPAVMEMSTFFHHLWPLRSRMGAWDCPARGARDFVDAHVLHNRRWEASFLPVHLGWWGVFGWGGVQPERSFPEDIEYVCARALATDSSLSYIAGVTPETLKTGGAGRFAGIAKRYEALRAAGTVPASIRARLAAPGREFTLDPKADGKFLPLARSRHTVTVTGAPAEVTVANPHGEQPLRLRIEALLSAGDPASPDAVVLTDFQGVGEFAPATAQQGVEAALTPGPAAVLTAKNTSAEPGRAWAAFRSEFAAPLNLTNRGLALTVEGDGQGAVLNVQLRASEHLGGGIADHYIPLDFKGRRQVLLVEPESDRLADWEWPHTRRRGDWAADPDRLTAFLYPMYHIWVDYASIASLSVGVTNLPKGKTVTAKVGPVHAVKLRAGVVANPFLLMGGQTMVFPVTLEAGEYLEYNDFTDCKVYDAQGAFKADIMPLGALPLLAAGDTVCAFAADPQKDGPVRARLTFTTTGEALKP